MCLTNQDKQKQGNLDMGGRSLNCSYSCKSNVIGIMKVVKFLKYFDHKLSLNLPYSNLPPPKKLP